MTARIAPGFRSTSVAVAIAVAVTVSFPIASSAQQGQQRRADIARDLRLPDVVQAERLEDILHAQALYEHVLRVGAGGAFSGPYTAPRHSDPTGPSYLWGGLDVIAVLDRYDEDVKEDRGGAIFINRDGKDIGDPNKCRVSPTDSSLATPEDCYLDVPTYPGSPVLKRALFKFKANKQRFSQMTNDGSLIIAFGLNCAWGVIAGPAENELDGSHWAQPGLAMIGVERFFGGKVTVLNLNLYMRGDDWKATEKRWKHAIEAFEWMLQFDQQWRRQRPEMPVIKVN
jgi:hypothetical protein